MRSIRAQDRCSVSTQSPLHLVPSEKCHLKRFRGVHVLVGKCMSLAKCYLKRWIPRLIESEDVVGMGSTVTAVMLHLASWQKKWAKENHSPAEVVQMGFPHMENTHTHSSPVGSWESNKMKVRFLFWITVFNSYYCSWTEEGLFGRATLLLSSISSSTFARRLSLSWISRVQDIRWAWGGAQLGSALLFAFAWVAACSWRLPRRVPASSAALEVRLVKSRWFLTPLNKMMGRQLFSFSPCTGAHCSHVASSLISAYKWFGACWGAGTSTGEAWNGILSSTSSLGLC